MKISNKTRYGIQFMLSLAIKYGEGYINIKDIAHKENISIKFLENIVSIIKPSDLIKVKRGAAGGYQLTRSPKDIKLVDIIELLEGEIMPVEIEEKSASNTTEITLVTHDFLKDLRNHFNEYLSSITLAQLVKQYQDKHGGVMYYI